MSVSSLLWTLLEVSERAAQIARECRSRKELFDLLVQEKTGSEKNPRFVEDFKTLADVLVQETVKHYLCKNWPTLKEFVHGEENNKFTNAKGQSIAVEIKASESETAQLLETVLDGNVTAARLLAEAIHQEPDVNPYVCKCYDLLRDRMDDETFDIDNIAIWIDPIDGTSEYIKGGWDTTEPPARYGLNCCLILIGGYDRTTGVPLFGTVSQPFTSDNTSPPSTASYFSFKFLHNLPPLPKRYAIVISSTESSEIRRRLEEVFTVTTASGAGYKILTVVLGLCDAYVCSRNSTYRWDTCAPHALLSAIGGGIRTFEDGQPIRYNVKNEKAACNEKGLIAYRSEEIYRLVSAVLNSDE